MSDISNRIAELSPEKRALLESRLLERAAIASSASEIVRQTRSGATPLSFAQQRLWFLDQLAPGNPFYSISSAYRVRGVLDRDVLQRAVAATVVRHEALRTTFAVVEGRPVQQIAVEQHVELPVVDISGMAEAEREKRMEGWIAAEARRPFDLAYGPLLRSALLRLAEQEHVLLLTVHHVVSDGWSMGILVKELAAFYEEFSGGRSAALPELPIQYADFACWQREWLSGEVLEKQLAYWKRQLADLPVLELPTDRPRPFEQTFRGAQHRTVFPERLTRALKELSRREGATLYMTLLAAFQALLLRYTGQEDIVVGSPIANRTRREIEGLIGFFVNMLVLRTDFSGEPSFRELLGRVREVALQAYAHQDLPFEKLVEELQPERNLAKNPLFQVMFAVQNAPAAKLELPGLTLSGLEVESRTTRLDLEVYLWESKGRLSGSFVYATDLFEASTIERLSRHFQVLLEGIVADPDRRVWELPLLTEAERRQVLEEWNQTETEYPRDKTVHGLFEEQVERTPQADAVVFGQERLTYEQLNERANRLARYLKKLGVGPEVLVGLCVERSLEMVVGLLGILKAGGAYVPLDPNYPRQRLAFMLEDSAAPVVLTQQSLSEALPEGSFERVRLDEDWPEIAQEESENPASQATAENLAYAIYTSGSTGRPKGVLIRHRSVANLFAATQPALGFDRTDVWTVFHSYAFDLSAWEIWGALLHGGRLVIVPPELTQSPVGFAQLLARESVTVASLTPTAARQLAAVRGDPAAWAAEWKLRLLICGGEALPAELAAELLSWDVPLWNFYGPTEATVWTSIKRVEPSDCRGPTVPIGRPIANTQAYVLDRHREPVPLGVPGELYIGGEGLARGYLRRTELDREKFIPHPFKREPGARLYATGDRARLLPDGTLEFLGRLDHQIKIRGYRVELGEIEAAISQHAGVREAVAVVRHETPVESRLVAYLVVDRDREPAVAQLRTLIRATLPDYMVPSAFVFLDALPLTPNGKIDRRALPAPGRTRPELESAPVAPRNAVEEALAEIWCEVLGLEGVGVRDDFFAIGGHSLLAVRLFSEIEKVIGRKLPLATLFQAPTIEELASILGRENWTAPWSPLVAIQPQGSKPPFFCVHPGGGQVLYYRDLARRLGPNQPFYGLQVNLFGQRDYQLLESIAGDYINEIRTVQPEGPYFLGGLCAGGMIAFEMAQQLHAQGQSVALLALLDTYAPGYPKLRPNEKSFRYKVYRFFRRIHLEGSNLLLLERREKLAYILEKAKRVRKYTRQRIRVIAKKLSKAIRPMPIQHPLPADLQQVPEYSRRLVKRYVPGVYPGRATVFRASNQPIGYESDPQLGWGELVAGGVETYEVPGHHESIALEPRVAYLALQLRQCLEKSQAVEKLDIDPVRAVGVGS